MYFPRISEEGLFSFEKNFKMKQFISEALIRQLQADTRRTILATNQLRAVDPGILLQQPAPGKWSVVQVIEHLGSYDRYYLVAIERALLQEKPAKPYFKAGWLGDYFTRIMSPRPDGTISNRMKSPAGHRPGTLSDALPVLNLFLEQQHYLIDLLEKARSKDLGSIRIPVTISRFIRMKLGDTFRFLQAHKDRHFVQIENTLEALGAATGKYPASRPAA